MNLEQLLIGGSLNWVLMKGVLMVVTGVVLPVPVARLCLMLEDASLLVLLLQFLLVVPKATGSLILGFQTSAILYGKILFR